jgi:hypothetical protein
MAIAIAPIPAYAKATEFAGASTICGPIAKKVPPNMSTPTPHTKMASGAQALTFQTPTAAQSAVIASRIAEADIAGEARAFTPARRCAGAFGGRLALSCDQTNAFKKPETASSESITAMTLRPGGRFLEFGTALDLEL